MTQQDYLLILFNDTGFTTESRYAWLTAQYKRSIKYLDDLTISERSFTIKRLKEIRAGQKT